MGTGAALLTALVWELYGGDGDVSTGTGLLSAGVGIMCGRAGSCACTAGVLSPPSGRTVLFEDRVFSPLDTGITCSNSNG